MLTIFDKRYFVMTLFFVLGIIVPDIKLLAQHIIPRIESDSCGISVKIERKPIIEKFVIPPRIIEPIITRCSPVEIIPNGFALSFDQYQVEQSNSEAFVGAGILGFIGFSYGMWGKQPHTYTVLESIEFELDNPRLNGIIMGVTGAILGAKLGSSIQRFKNERKKDPGKKIIEIREGQGCLF